MITGDCEKFSELSGNNNDVLNYIKNKELYDL